MLGFHAKALKSPRLQPLGATPARDPAVCGSFWLSQEAAHFNTTFQHNSLQC